MEVVGYSDYGYKSPPDTDNSATPLSRLGI